MRYDIAIIGAGVIGGMAARELSRYDLRVCLLEKENDVAMGATRANSGIIHGGYDPEPGTLMAKYNVLGNAMYDDLCKEVDDPFRRVGSYVLAFSEKEKEHLEMFVYDEANDKVLYNAGKNISMDSSYKQGAYSIRIANNSCIKVRALYVY